jgi:hypothetical protein
MGVCKGFDFHFAHGVLPLLAICLMIMSGSRTGDLVSWRNAGIAEREKKTANNEENTRAQRNGTARL